MTGRPAAEFGGIFAEHRRDDVGDDDIVGAGLGGKAGPEVETGVDVVATGVGSQSAMNRGDARNTSLAHTHLDGLQPRVCSRDMEITREQLLGGIWIDPARCSGKPCIRGHRIWVSLILDLLASGESQVMRDA